MPLPWAADDHQTANAQAVARVGGALVLPQGGTTPQQVAGWIARLAGDRALVARMGVAAVRLARPEAAARVAALVEGLDLRSARNQRAIRRSGARDRAQRGVLGGLAVGRRRSAR